MRASEEVYSYLGHSLGVDCLLLLVVLDNFCCLLDYLATWCDGVGILVIGPSS